MLMLSSSPKCGVSLAPTGEESDSGPDGRLLPGGPFGYDVFACTLFQPMPFSELSFSLSPHNKPVSQSATLFNSLLFSPLSCQR